MTYLTLAIIYPIDRRFSDEHAGIFMKGISLISGYFVPFLLYLFLFVLLYDILLPVNNLFRLISRERRMSFPFRLYTLTGFCLASVIIVVAGAINLNTVRISEYTVEVPRKKSETEHLRMAFTSDIHINTDTRIEFINQFVRKVNALEPDLVLFGGDIIEGDSEKEITGAVRSSFKRIQARYGVFGVLGNHEHYGGKIQEGFFRKMGIHILADTVIRIDSLFYLAGRNDQHIKGRKTVFQLMENINNDLPVILMDHRPTEIKEVSRTIVDVQLSGHTHNGQLFPVNLITNRIYDLSRGYRKTGNTHFFVCSGLRLWGPPVKTAGKSEIMLIDLYFR
jgi:predicted MPP superfamily phosphohydrolase